MNYLTLSYRGKEYTWEEFNNEHIKFINQLELPDDLLINWGIRDFSVVHDVGYSIAISKFRELYRVIASARYALINAHQKFYDSNVIGVEGDYRNQIWMRSQFLKNSIIWYNSCEDYIFQILWFGFDMHKTVIESRENYLLLLQKAVYGKIIKELEGLKGSSFEVHADRLAIRIQEYREYTSYLRDNLANNLKHRGNLNFSGIEDLRSIRYSAISKEKSKRFDTEWIEPDVIDIDDTINILKDIHIKLLEFARFILDYMDFDNMFEVDDQEQYVMNTIKNKRDYKKIIFD